MNTSNPVEPRLGSAPPRRVLCTGEPRVMGQAQGLELATDIACLRRDLSRLEPFRLRQPWWMPYPLYRWGAERSAERHLAAALQKHDPAMQARLEGIADAAGLSRGALSLFNALEPFLSSVGGCIACGHGCSAVALRGSRSANGNPVIARNFDYLELVQPYHLVRENRPAEGLRSLEFTLAPLAGAMDGVNEAGLCIVYDYAFTLDQPPEPAPSISMLVSGALQRCLTVAEAADYLAGRSRWGGALLMMADATGDIASLEISSTRCELRRPAVGQDYCLHTNRFQTTGMRLVEAPEDAVLDARAPEAMRGKRLHESAERRAQRLEELMQQGGSFGLDELNRVMADHGPEGKPSAYTPCVHSNYWNTTTTVQLLPRSRTLRIAFTRPCEARFHEFTL